MIYGRFFDRRLMVGWCYHPGGGYDTIINNDGDFFSYRIARRLMMIMMMMFMVNNVNWRRKKNDK